MFHWLKARRSATPSAPRGASGSRSPLRRQVERLETSADPADVTTLARLWNRLATQAEAEGSPEALACFGRAIDAYLEAGYFDAAAAMCRRLIRLHPEVVRARCTLAFLSIGRRHLGDAVQEITEYTMASKRTGTEELAVSRLRLMAQATSDASVRRRIASALAEMGDEEGRDAVLETPPAAEAQDDGKRWERLLAVALLDRSELRRRVGPEPVPTLAPVRSPGASEAA